MVFKISLVMALLLYLCQALAGVPFETNLMRSLFYFILFYALSFGYHILHLHIKLRLLKIEQQQMEEKRKKEREMKEKQMASTLAHFIRDAKVG